MKYRNLGAHGPLVSPLVLGTDNFANPTSANESERIILSAIEAGINLIDTSNSYARGESERIIGKTLAESGLRNEIVLATKVFYPTGPLPDDRGLSRAAIFKACEDSLMRLRTDYIDLYQLHRPDFEVPHEETLRALDDLVRQGKVRFIGSSTAPADRILEGVRISEEQGLSRYVSEQPPYNLLDRRIENEVLPMCRKENIGVITWSPLAMGMLAGRYLDNSALPYDSRAVERKGIYAERVTPGAIAAGNRFARMAKDHGFDPAHLALVWVKEQPGITAAIIGPKTVRQLEILLPVLNMDLPDEIRRICDEMFPPGSAVADFHNTSGWTKKMAP
jgi:aryl-alcohol dehydrogenase-like predicted oxidoreductase